MKKKGYFSKVKEKITSDIERGGAAYNRYQKGKAKREKAKLESLKRQTAIAKQQAELRKAKASSSPSFGYSMDSGSAGSAFSGTIGGPVWGNPPAEKKAQKRKKKRKRRR